jgi:integrase
VAKLDRPRYERTPPNQVPSVELMDAVIEAAKRRKRPRDIAIFLILRYTGMRRESVAQLRLRHLDGHWGLRGVYTKGGKTRDIPLPSVVTKFLQSYVDLVLAPEVGEVTGDTPLFWSRWAGRRGARRLMPIQGKNIWRLCKTYGRLIGTPELKPHDLRHGVAMRCSSNITIWSRSARSSATRASTQPRSTRRSARSSSSAQSRSTRTRLHACWADKTRL